MFADNAREHCQVHSGRARVAYPIHGALRPTLPSRVGHLPYIEAGTVWMPNRINAWTGMTHDKNTEPRLDHLV